MKINFLVVDEEVALFIMAHRELSPFSMAAKVCLRFSVVESYKVEVVLFCWVHAFTGEYTLTGYARIELFFGD